MRQKKHTGANQQRRTKSLVSCTHLGCMKEENGKLNRFSTFKKRVQYTYHSALQRRIQNGGKRTEAKPMKSSQVLLHNCQGHSTATFRHKEGAERTEPERTRNDRASKRTAAVKKGPAKAGRDAGSPGGGGRAAPLDTGLAPQQRGCGAERRPKPDAFGRGLGEAAPHLRSSPRPTTPARGCAGRSRRQERPLPPQAFVHEAQIPAVAVSVLILDFRLPRGLHGTGDGERGRNRRPAQGLRARNTPPGLAEARPDGAGRKPHLQPTEGPFPPGRRREAGSRRFSTQGVLPFYGIYGERSGLAVKRDIFAAFGLLRNE